MLILAFYGILDTLQNVRTVRKIFRETFILIWYYSTSVPDLVVKGFD